MNIFLSLQRKHLQMSAGTEACMYYLKDSILDERCEYGLHNFAFPAALHKKTPAAAGVKNHLIFPFYVLLRR